MVVFFQISWFGRAFCLVGEHYGFYNTIRKLKYMLWNVFRRTRKRTRKKKEVHFIKKIDQNLCDKMIDLPESLRVV